MAAQGSATLDFGVTPTDRASVAVTGQAGIAAGSAAEAFLMAETSVDHDADAHTLAAALIDLVCGSVVADTGFTINAICPALASGRFTVRWVWS